MGITEQGYRLRERAFELKRDNPTMTLEAMSAQMASEGLVTANGRPYSQSHLSQVLRDVAAKLDRAWAERRIKELNIEGARAEAAVKFQLLIEDLEKQLDEAKQAGETRLYTALVTQYRQALKDYAGITGEGESRTQTHRFEGFDPAESMRRLREIKNDG